MREKLALGVSSCLLGQEVRFDRGHKRDAYIVATLGQYFEFVPVCPEMAIGLGTPREPIRLVGDPSRPRVVGVRTAGLDVTEALETYGRCQGEAMRGLRGYIFKRGSPSCGMERVKVYAAGGTPAARGRGVYARELMAAQPLLPVEEEGRLGDPVLRENFLERVFVFHRWLSLREAGLTPAGLVDFHSRHKLLVMAHSQAGYRRLGRIVAGAGSEPLAALADRYAAELMGALVRRATPKTHGNVLLHLVGYLKNILDHDDKAELLETVNAYRAGGLPLIVPITLLRHHFRRHPHRYVERQHYMQPHPAELMLRNLV